MYYSPAFPSGLVLYFNLMIQATKMYHSDFVLHKRHIIGCMHCYYVNSGINGSCIQFLWKNAVVLQALFAPRIWRVQISVSYWMYFLQLDMYLIFMFYESRFCVKWWILIFLRLFIMNFAKNVLCIIGDSLNTDCFVGSTLLKCPWIERNLSAEQKIVDDEWD